jgi:hypothetical protein
MTEKLYETLSKKLHDLRHVHRSKQDISLNTRIKKPSFSQKFHPRIQNLTDVHRFRKETKIMELGIEHNFEKSTK